MNEATETATTPTPEADGALCTLEGAAAITWQPWDAAEAEGIVGTPAQWREATGSAYAAARIAAVVNTKTPEELAQLAAGIGEDTLADALEGLRHEERRAEALAALYGCAGARLIAGGARWALAEERAEAAGQDPGAANPDAELLRLGAALDRAQAEEAALLAAPGAGDDADLDAALAPVGRIVGRIEALPARTLDGLRVKARAARWCRHDPADAPPERHGTTDDRLAWGIVRDLLSLPAPAAADLAEAARA